MRQLPESFDHLPCIAKLPSAVRARVLRDFRVSAAGGAVSYVRFGPALSPVVMRPHPAFEGRAVLGVREIELSALWRQLQGTCAKAVMSVGSSPEKNDPDLWVTKMSGSRVRRLSSLPAVVHAKVATWALGGHS